MLALQMQLCESCMVGEACSLLRSIAWLPLCSAPSCKATERPKREASAQALVGTRSCMLLHLQLSMQPPSNSLDDAPARLLGRHGLGTDVPISIAPLPGAQSAGLGILRADLACLSRTTSCALMACALAALA